VTALDREVRKSLDRAVRRARIIAEDGARKALTELGVEDARRPDSLSPEQIELRKRLRSHARALGDARMPGDSLKANRLAREIAYEHWHRALFARFLAENNLLIDPEHNVAVSLAELEEIAQEERRDPVELAADWAEPMLPQIFRQDDPVLELALPPETKEGIVNVVRALPRAVFLADDALGWVYQFWQADENSQVNEEVKTSGKKIGADELPAVTQLFTEDYMVLFLLESTLGAWWAGKILATNHGLAAAESEDELREKTSPPGYRWTYLRFVREPREGETQDAATGSWRPAPGTFEGWPTAAKEIKVLDPCMGSGHFLVFALPILVAFRRAEEGLDERAAVSAVLAENLYGLELDPRCTQIAAFALALASWKRLGQPEALPRLNLACSGLAIGLGKPQFLELAEKIADAEGWIGANDLLGTDRTPLGASASAVHRGELDALYSLFEQAPYLGSLIDSHRMLERSFGPLYTTGINKLDTILERLLNAGQATAETREVAVAAQGLAKAAELLGRDYTLIATNIPFLGRNKQHRVLADYIDQHYPDHRQDLYGAFIARIMHFCTDGTSIAFVAPQNWYFTKSFIKTRKFLVKNARLVFVVDLGRAAFDDMNWWASTTSLSIITRDHCGCSTPYVAIQANGGKGPVAKARNMYSRIFLVCPDHFIESDNHLISFYKRADGDRLGDYCDVLQGVGTTDLLKYTKSFWENNKIEEYWDFYQLAPLTEVGYAGCTDVLLWDSGKGALGQIQTAYKGIGAVGRKGIGIAVNNNLRATIFNGDRFDCTLATILPKTPDLLTAVCAYLFSTQFKEEVRKVDQALSVTEASFLKVPFDLSYWQRVASEKYPRGLPKPYSNDPTQWLFDGHPRGSANPNVAGDSITNAALLTPHGVRPGVAEYPLQVAVARLLGYRWPRQTGSSFMDCPAVPELDEVDRSGLVDTDGIVPLPALAGQADATTRLRELIRVVWGPNHSEGTIRELLATGDAKATDLGTWLADEFFDSHCKLFQQTPFIWHIWDGLRGGFSALMNYHRLCEGNGAGRRLLEKLRDSYLGEWIAAQRRAFAAGEAGAEERLIAAEHLRGELTKIIEGEPPYDIFVRWKPLYLQPIGWEPDIDDGVRLNIRPFLAARPKNSGRRDGCVLRVTPRVKKHAGADRGAEPRREKEDFPWFWAEGDDVAEIDFVGGPQLKGHRYNDFHYTRAFKQRARDAKVAILKGVA
jgi:hypothetical protein